MKIRTRYTGKFCTDSLGVFIDGFFNQLLFCVSFIHMKKLLPVCLLIMTSFTGFRPGLRTGSFDRRRTGPFDKLRTGSVLTIRFRHMAGNRVLQLYDDDYRNDWGEPFTVRQFRYYIHRLSCVDDKGISYEAPEAYYLVDEADSNSKTIRLPAPEGVTRSIHFIVGVDSSDNTSGAQTGALDPVKGMFWTWNSGYIFAKLEGRSDSSHAPGRYFSYHVGGFKQGRNAEREVVLPVMSTVPGRRVVIVQADVLAWFRSVHPIAIAQSPVCHEPGAMALQLADNYANMFSIAETP